MMASRFCAKLSTTKARFHILNLLIYMRDRDTNVAVPLASIVQYKLGSG